VVNYDPDSAGVAATERSLAGLLEEGFDVRVLALPSALDPDAFIRKQGGAAYEKLLSEAPSYIDYLTERAASQHDLSRPEGRVAAANALLPHVAKVPDAMLRTQLAQGLALRLRLDQRSVQEELKRAALRRETQVKPEAAARKENLSVKLLLRACLESPELADEFASELVESGDCKGLTGAQVFRRIAELRGKGETLEVALLEESLSPEEKGLVYESLFWPGDPVDRALAQACRQKLRLERAQREGEQLRAEIERAEREKDVPRVAELIRAKQLLDRKLREAGRP